MVKNINGKDMQDFYYYISFVKNDEVHYLMSEDILLNLISDASRDGTMTLMTKNAKVSYSFTVNKSGIRAHEISYGNDSKFIILVNQSSMLPVLINVNGQWCPIIEAK